MLTGRSYTTSLGRPCLRESEASAGEFPLVFDGLGVFRGHFYRVIDFPNPRQNCHRTTIGPGVMYSQGRQTLFANLYAESGARNRSEGNQLTLRYLLAF